MTRPPVASNQRAIATLRRTGEAGFTLLEIMIVISIISVLAAFAIPQMLDAQRQAQRSRALATMKQIFDAQMRYKEKNGTYAPNIATLVAAKILSSPFTTTTLGMQTIGYYEYDTCVPVPSSASLSVTSQANATVRFRVGAQPIGTSDSDRLKRGQQMFMLLETGRFYEHKAPACNLSHVESTIDSTHDSAFGPSYPEIGSQ